MRQMLVVGPFPWQAIGVSPGDWKNVQIDESFGEADAEPAPARQSLRRHRHFADLARARAISRW